MKVFNYSKMPIVVCKVRIDRFLSAIISDELWQKEYSENKSLKVAVSKGEIRAFLETDNKI